MKKILRLSIPVWILISLLSGCQVVQQFTTAPTPTITNTPMLQLEQIPVMPTLPPLQPTPTQPPEAYIHYTTENDLFKQVTDEIVPLKGRQKAVLMGMVGEIREDDFTLVHSSGNEYTVSCDDYCFYTDREKNLIAEDAMKSADTVMVFGTSADEAVEIHADLIAVKMNRQYEPAEVPDLSQDFTYGLKYKEYELKLPPEVNPIRIQAAHEEDEEEQTLDERLTGRLRHSLENRTNYSKGYYGETYSSYLEYESDQNRDPEHLTRASLVMESNGYEFCDFWIPYARNPMFTLWGIVCYGGDWYQPIRFSVDIDPSPDRSNIVFCDRTISNQMNFDGRKGYLRSFGHSIIEDKLFYFYEKENGYGISIGMTDYDLGFDNIPFGYVAEYSELDPFYADDMITFFGHRNGKWYYVEITAAEEQGYYYY